VASLGLAWKAWKAWPGLWAKSSDGIGGSAGSLVGFGGRDFAWWSLGCVSHVLQFCLSHEALRDVGW
jgi:hypothetical protein